MGMTRIRIDYYRPVYVTVSGTTRPNETSWSTSSVSVGDVVERVRVGPATALLALVQLGDRDGVVRAQLEIEDLEVLLDPLRRHRLGEHDVTALDVPPQNDLCRR